VLGQLGHRDLPLLVVPDQAIDLFIAESRPRAKLYTGLLELPLHGLNPDPELDRQVFQIRASGVRSYELFTLQIGETHVRLPKLTNLARRQSTASPVRRVRYGRVRKV
jgi:hypothetical protein